MNYNNMDDEFFGSCVSSTVLKADHTQKCIKDLHFFKYKIVILL